MRVRRRRRDLPPPVTPTSQVLLQTISEMARPAGQIRASDTRTIPHRRGFSADTLPHTARTRERSGLIGFHTPDGVDVSDTPDQAAMRRIGTW